MMQNLRSNWVPAIIRIIGTLNSCARRIIFCEIVVFEFILWGPVFPFQNFITNGIHHHASIDPVPS